MSESYVTIPKTLLNEIDRTYFNNPRIRYTSEDGLFEIFFPEGTRVVSTQVVVANDGGRDVLRVQVK